MSKLVLFDCDGVLINTEEIGYYVIQEMLAEHNVNYSRTDYVELLSGITYEEFHEKLRTDNPHLPEDFRDELDARMKAAHDEQMAVIDGVVELLQNLKENNIPFAVCSNSGATSLREKLREVGLYDSFVPHIYSRHDVENPKPAPDMYELAARIHGVDPKNCIVVEDTITGTMAGVAAGMNVIGFVGEAHREIGEAELLADAGARMIANSAEEIWSHISDFYGMSPRFPYLGPDMQL